MAYTYLTPYLGGGQMSGPRGGGLFDLHRQMNRLFDELFDTSGDTSGGGGGLFGAGARPALDIHQEDDRIEITAELPGVKEEDIDLSVEDGVLCLAGEKKSSREDSESGYRERSYGRFERRITLPSNVDEEKIEADFRDGVLTVTLPKAEKERGRKIRLGQSSRSEQELIESGEGQTASPSAKAAGGEQRERQTENA